MTIDPETRDVIHNIYLRRVEKMNGEFWNIEFATVENGGAEIAAGGAGAIRVPKGVSEQCGDN
jgi:hypothetical protein